MYRHYIVHFIDVVLFMNDNKAYAIDTKLIGHWISSWVSEWMNIEIVHLILLGHIHALVMIWYQEFGPEWMEDFEKRGLFGDKKSLLLKFLQSNIRILKMVSYRDMNFLDLCKRRTSKKGVIGWEGSSNMGSLATKISLKKGLWWSIHVYLKLYFMYFLPTPLDIWGTKDSWLHVAVPWMPWLKNSIMAYERLSTSLGSKTLNNTSLGLGGTKS